MALQSAGPRLLCIMAGNPTRSTLRRMVSVTLPIVRQFTNILSFLIDTSILPASPHALEHAPPSHSAPGTIGSMHCIRSAHCATIQSGASIWIFVVLSLLSGSPAWGFAQPHFYSRFPSPRQALQILLVIQSSPMTRQDIETRKLRKAVEQNLHNTGHPTPTSSDPVSIVPVLLVIP